MEEDVCLYHCLHNRGLAVSQETGTIRLNTLDHKISQFIGPKPFSGDCNRFSIKITRPGRETSIGLGLCCADYPPGRMVGWNKDSIGYHADNGGIYHEYGIARKRFGRVQEDEIMECSVDFNTGSVTFKRNGEKVYTSDPLQFPVGGFYPIVCLCYLDEVVSLLETDPWTPDPVVNGKRIYNSLFCRDVTVSHRSGIVRYQKLYTNKPCGQLVSECPLSREVNKFSVEIVNLGENSGITIGVCHRLFPSNSHPGWLPNTIAYHIGKGEIFHESDEARAVVPKARVGDFISCEIDFTSMMIIFRRNGQMVFDSSSVLLPEGGFHAVLSFCSAGESVCLLEKEPWQSHQERLSSSSQDSLHTNFEKLRLSDNMTNQNTDGHQSTKAFHHMNDPRPIFPKCCICLHSGVARFLIPCGHSFCVNCIDAWSSSHPTCPACRVKFHEKKNLYY